MVCLKAIFLPSLSLYFNKGRKSDCLVFTALREVVPSVGVKTAIVVVVVKSLQSCPTLCDPIDGSPPGSPIPGILQARSLEWVAISFSNA